MAILNQETLFSRAQEFAEAQSKVNHPTLIGVTDGKAVGTYVEHLFEDELRIVFPNIEIGSSARGIDLPDSRLNTDIKVTSIRQPQSSCPYRDARQKIYGLGYNLLLFVYEKIDTLEESKLIFHNVTLIDNERTGDYTLTKMLRDMVDIGANEQDIAALLNDKALPGDEITLRLIAREVLEHKPPQGYLTISNALQWRLQYQRVINLKNQVIGVQNYER